MSMYMNLINIATSAGEIVRAKGRDPAVVAAMRSAVVGKPDQSPAKPTAMTLAELGEHIEQVHRLHKVNSERSPRALMFAGWA
jgi:2,3-bisphosphoglycerate-independent phosphoglycerate mutase